MKPRLLFVIVVAVFGLALARLHFRVEAMLTGYRIGKLKEKETELLSERANSFEQHAQATSKRNLEKAANL